MNMFYKFFMLSLTNLFKAEGILIDLGWQIGSIATHIWIANVTMAIAHYLLISLICVTRKIHSRFSTAVTIYPGANYDYIFNLLCIHAEDSLSVKPTSIWSILRSSLWTNSITVESYVLSEKRRFRRVQENGMGYLDWSKDDVYEPAIGSTHVINFKGRNLRIELVGKDARASKSLKIRCYLPSEGLITSFVAHAKAQYLAITTGTLVTYIPDPDNFSKWICKGRDWAPNWDKEIPFGNMTKHKVLGNIEMHQNRVDWNASSSGQQSSTRGFLISGESGMGKSQLVDGLAGKMNLDVYMLDLKSAQSVTEHNFRQLVAAVPSGAVIYIKNFHAPYAREYQSTFVPVYSTTNSYESLEPTYKTPQRSLRQFNLENATRMSSKVLEDALRGPKVAGRILMFTCEEINDLPKWVCEKLNVESLRITRGPGRGTVCVNGIVDYEYPRCPAFEPSSSDSFDSTTTWQTSMQVLTPQDGKSTFPSVSSFPALDNGNNHSDSTATTAKHDSNENIVFIKDNKLQSGSYPNSNSDKQLVRSPTSFSEDFMPRFPFAKVTTRSTAPWDIKEPPVRRNYTLDEALEELF